MDRIKCCDNCRHAMDGVCENGLYCGVNDIEVYPSNKCKDWSE